LAPTSTYTSTVPIRGTYRMKPEDLRPMARSRPMA
jgi:hypothetical protein